MRLVSKKGAFLLAAAGLLLFLCFSCTPKVQGLVQDPDFTAGAIMDNGLAVGAVTGPTGPLPQGDASLYGRVLIDRITKERKLFRVKPLEQVMTAMGPEAYGKMVAQYAQNGIVSQEFLQDLKSVQGARYLIFARIDADTVDHSNSTSSNEVVVKRDQNGNPVKTQTEVTNRYTTTRSASVGFDIYDTSTGRSVWSGSLQDTASTGTDYKDISDPGKNGWDTLAKDVVRNVVLGPREYPSPPPLQQVLEGIFKGFAKGLPKS
ncbi:MAG: hypothetical protein AB1921_09920 [Thermodesulfobacteriota bacterium]